MDTVVWHWHCGLTWTLCLWSGDMCGCSTRNMHQAAIATRHANLLMLPCEPVYTCRGSNWAHSLTKKYLSLYTDSTDVLSTTVSSDISFLSHALSSSDQSGHRRRMKVVLDIPTCSTLCIVNSETQLIFKNADIWIFIESLWSNIHYTLHPGMHRCVCAHTCAHTRTPTEFSVFTASAWEMIKW